MIIPVMNSKRRAQPKTGPDAEPEIAALAQRIGSNIKRLRRERHLTQTELARRIGMPPPALNAVEKGSHVPAGRTLYLVAKMLGVTANDLFEIPDPETLSPVAWLPVEGLEDNTPPPHIHALARAYLTLEDLCNVPRRPTIPLHPAFDISEKGMADLAAVMRHHLGVTHAIIFDYLELLENAGIRILFCDLPNNIESLSAFDPLHTNAFIFVSSSLSTVPERQLFRLIYELGRVLLHARWANTGQTLKLKRQTRMPKFFAGHFLMPDSAVRATVRRLGVSPDSWDFDLLCRIKTRFGVSAESFLYTLNDLKLIKPRLSESILKQLYAHYEATGYSEPGQRFRRLNPNAAFLDLLHIATQRGVSDPEQAKELEQIGELIIKYGQQSDASSVCATQKTDRNNSRRTGREDSPVARLYPASIGNEAELDEFLKALRKRLSKIISDGGTVVLE